MPPREEKSMQDYINNEDARQVLRSRHRITRSRELAKRQERQQRLMKMTPKTRKATPAEIKKEAAKKRAARKAARARGGRHEQGR